MHGPTDFTSSFAWLRRFQMSLQSLLALFRPAVYHAASRNATFLQDIGLYNELLGQSGWGLMVPTAKWWFNTIVRSASTTRSGVEVLEAIGVPHDPSAAVAAHRSKTDTVVRSPCTRSRRSHACPDSTPSSHACSRPRSLQACLGPRGRHRTACTWRSARARCRGGR